MAELKSAAAEVGAELWKHVTDPFYDKGPNDKGAGSPDREVLAVTGKGGVGKTNIVANLGALYAESGKRVLLIDADYGLANLAVGMGVSPITRLITKKGKTGTRRRPNR